MCVSVEFEIFGQQYRLEVEWVAAMWVRYQTNLDPDLKCIQIGILQYSIWAGSPVSHIAYWKQPWNLLRKVFCHCSRLRVANNGHQANFSHFSSTFFLLKTPLKTLHALFLFPKTPTTATLSTGQAAGQQGRTLAVSVAAPVICVGALNSASVFLNPHRSVINSKTGFLGSNFRVVNIVPVAKLFGVLFPKQTFELGKYMVAIWVSVTSRKCTKGNFEPK